ncbi:replicative DNA helicase [Paenibacillus sp. EKM206P]|uniref:replicative DNA helicase n=1 Tax=Paenibacillus sp. EKM206P TaxID=1683674 RepID=UPI001EEB7CC4|nr:replicative DNA helicase [Paenibacillus sp. EKM206P]
MNVLENLELPYNLETEQAVLGAMLIDADSVEIATSKLKSDAFFDAGNRLIYQTLADLHEAQEPIDLVTVTTQLQNNGQLTDVGGVSYLSQLAHGVPTTANTGHYVAQLEDAAIRREFIRTSMLQIQQAAAGKEVPQLLASMQNTANKLSDRAAPEQDFKRVRDVLVEVVESSEIRFDNFKNGTVTGLQTGFTDLDSITAGLQNSDLIIVAARPSVGKTAFALNVAQNVAVRTPDPVAVFSLEMSAAQLVQRMVCAEGNLDASKMRMGDFAEEDWGKIAAATGVLGATNIMIDDTPGITVHEIRAKCRRLKKQEGLGLVVIDYLQLIQGRGKSSENRQQEVSEISRTLKQLARELDVPVIALSQLSRAVEQRQDKRPMMSDLRESGSIEQDADIVAFLYRDDYYNQDTEKKNIIEIIIGKQRNGPVGTVELVFLKQYNKFANYERTHSEYQPAAQPPKNTDKRRWAH